MAEQKRYLFLTDSPNHPVSRDIKKLYPDLVGEMDVSQEEISPDRLVNCEAVITMCRKAEAVERFNQKPIMDYAAGGGLVISCLYEYAYWRGLPFLFRHTGQIRPMIEIIEECDVTRGFSRGDRLYWYRNANDVDDPSVGDYSYREIEVEGTIGRRILARSCMTGGAVMIEERVNRGRLVAMDLYSPMDLSISDGDPHWNHPGAFNKYVFLGNLLGRTVRYGSYVSEKLPYGSFVERLRSMCGPRDEFRIEGIASDGSNIYSMTVGNTKGKMFYFQGVKHGVEWENAYGLLCLLESLKKDPPLDLQRFCVKVIPILNPYGYIHGCRHNANGVDLNRNQRPDWDRFRGWTDEVVAPWVFDYKGPRRLSEPEAELERNILRDQRIICFADFHGMVSGTMMDGSGPDPEVVIRVGEEFERIFANRYLIKGVHDRRVHQVSMMNRPQRENIEQYKSEGNRYDFVCETYGQFPGTYATVMQTDYVAEVGRTILRMVALDAIRKEEGSKALGLGC